MKRRLLALALIPLALACSKEEPAKSAAAPAAALPERFWAAQEPAGARPVAEVRASAQDGERVVLVGSVGGAVKPFVEDTAAFSVVDPKLASCVGDGTGCATPWDYCCVDPRTLLEGTATVELRAGAAPIAASARGFHGLDHLDTVVVEGVAERDESGNLVVAAERLHVRP